MTNIEYEKNQIGIKIKNKRISKKIKQKDLATKLQISNVHLSYIEKGKRCPSLQLLYDVANELNIPMNELLSVKGID